METIAHLSDERLNTSQAVSESLNRTTMLKHSEATRARKPKPAPVTRLDQPQLIQIDSDLMPGLIDMWGASGEESFAVWLGKFASDAMRGNLGL